MIKKLLLIFVLLTLNIFSSVAWSQDGYLFSAPPPVTFRFDSSSWNAYFTNTGDKIIHAVTVTRKKDGSSDSKVIIDTIEPHKTVSVNLWVDNPVLLIGETVDLTCKDYSKPIQVTVH